LNWTSVTTWRILLIAVTAFASFANSLPNPFIWDDSDLVQPPWTDPQGASFAFIWSGDFWSWTGAGRTSGYYRPLIALSYAIEQRVWGFEPWGYRLTNIAGHIACSALVFILGGCVGLSANAALLAGLLFAVHPVHTESVAFISGRTDVFCAVGLLIAAITVFRPRVNAALGIAGVVSLTAAFGCKELALAFPVLLVAAWRLHLPSESLLRRRSWAVLPVAFLLAGAYLWLRSWAIGGIFGGAGGGSSLSLGQMPLAFSAAIYRYLILTVAPFHLSADHDWDWSAAARQPDAWLGAMFFVVAAWWLLGRGRRSPFALPLAWWLIMLAPSLAALPSLGLFAERFLYVPSAGLCLAAGVALDRTGRRAPAGGAEKESFFDSGSGSGGLLRAALPLALCVVFMVATVLRNRDWSSDLTLWGSTTAASPMSYRARINHGAALREQRLLPHAIHQFRRATELAPSDPRGFGNLSAALFDAGQPAQAICGYLRALQRDRRDPKILIGMARAFIALGLWPDAARAMDAALALDPNREDVQYQIGIILLDHGRPEAAEQIFHNLARIRPQMVDAHLALGSALAQQGKIAAARNAFERVLHIIPDDARAKANLELIGRTAPAPVPIPAPLTAEQEATIRANLGNELMASGHMKDAADQYQQAAELEPDSAEIRNNLAIAYANLGEVDKARAEWRRILDKNPEHASSRANLAQLDGAGADAAP